MDYLLRPLRRQRAQLERRGPPAKPDRERPAVRAGRLNLCEGNRQTERPAKDQFALLQERRAARGPAVEAQRASGLRTHVTRLLPSVFALPSSSWAPVFCLPPDQISAYCSKPARPHLRPMARYSDL